MPVRRMCVLVAFADQTRARRASNETGPVCRLGAGTVRPRDLWISGAQRDGRVRTLVGHDRAAITGQLGVAVLEALALLPLALETGDVLPVAFVGALPGLGHLGLRQARVGPPAHCEPRYHLAGPAPARRARWFRRTESGEHFDTSAAIAAVLVEGHRLTGFRAP
jgi:hypothetical protein